MQILQHEHQRPRRGQHLQCLGQLAQHALPGGPQHAALHRLQGVGREEGRHLHQPGRRLLRQPGHELGPVRPAPELPQGLEDRQVGFAGAIRLDALPPGQPQVWCLGHLRQKGVYHRRLADAGLARHEAHLAYAASRLRQPLVELRDLGLPPNGPGRRERRGGRGCRQGRERHRGGQAPPPAIAPAGHRLEVLRGLHRIA